MWWDSSCLNVIIEQKPSLEDTNRIFPSGDLQQDTVHTNSLIQSSKHWTIYRINKITVPVPLAFIQTGTGTGTFYLIYVPYCKSNTVTGTVLHRFVSSNNENLKCKLLLSMHRILGTGINNVSGIWPVVMRSLSFFSSAPGFWNTLGTVSWLRFC